ncbi:hypothetical protein ONS95_007199 [Cadophora gregata]|uniref:uncharacterized protein n=1 Tax=Cadophora gregata TaxID=51156 RepID=UPI0026DD647C|nr:uncharacterized protein ONS95_007199 [Cadophora gregata]KAK0100749.1 hypothetical protein ONS95_007199 [Cadophora gregata]
MASYLQRLLSLGQKSIVTTGDPEPQKTQNGRDSDLLNSMNKVLGLPKSSDVVVVGGGIHSLIFAIHARTIELKKNPSSANPIRSITILEKCPSPSYKIGESTLTVFGLWLKLIGISSPMLWRLFGPKDGLALYYFSESDNTENVNGNNYYTSFVANGPPGDVVATLQIERKVSELMLTLFAQRLGITVLHGKQVVVDGETVVGVSPGSSPVSSPSLGNKEDMEDCVNVKFLDVETKKQESINARLIIDATGRFHRFASKAKHRIERPEGFNTHAFWAYWECNVDEEDIPLRDYESVNTNHICIPEGWAWVIRLPTWEGTPLTNLTAMINHLLDLNASLTPGDAYLSTGELIKRFNLSFRWVISIGFALRSDTIFPSQTILNTHGCYEEEQKFNWVVSKYAHVREFMGRFTLIEDLYGEGTTWFTRKNIAFRAPRVSGCIANSNSNPNSNSNSSVSWMAIGDATGFTNPLYSPGINANMGTSIFVAEMLESYFSPSISPKLKSEERQALCQKYEKFCEYRIENLQRMNVFNYMLFRSPELGPLGPLWQYLIGTGNQLFRNTREYTLETAGQKLLTRWDCRCKDERYIVCASKTITLLSGPVSEPLSRERVEEVREWIMGCVREAVETGEYKGRWGGLLRYCDDGLVFRGEGKRERDVLARRCEGCGEWRMMRGDCCRCPFCGWVHPVEMSTKVLYGI